MLEVRDLWKSYEGAPLLCGVSFQVARGETVCLLGASGSGKSTILRIIAGFEDTETGQVLWEGRDLAGMPVHQRNFGLMFQEYALFPHLNVSQNVAFGLRMHGMSQEAIETRVQAALKQVNLQGFARRRTTDLSGGEQQRVALARALAPQPRLLMLDEPLGALDRTLREQLMEELRRILHETQIPAIYVTHDQEEAFSLADRLLLLHEGRIVQAGTPAQVYEQPASIWVAQFLGLGNILNGEVLQSDPLVVQTSIGKFQAACPHRDNLHDGHRVGNEIALLLRPGGAQVAVGPGEALNQVHGEVLDVIFREHGFRVNLQAKSVTGGTDPKLEYRFILKEAPTRGQSLTLMLPPQEVVCLGS